MSSNNQTLLLEAYTNLGFKLSENRFQSFLNLFIQHLISEEKLSEQKEQSRQRLLSIYGREYRLKLSLPDKIEMATVNFIQLYGDELWPGMLPNRGHLNDRWYTKRRCDFVWICEKDQDCKVKGNNDRSLWEEKIRSPLGCAVKRYAEIVVKMGTTGEVLAPVDEAMDELVKEVLFVHESEVRYG